MEKRGSADIFGDERVDCTAFLTFTEGFLDDALARSSTRHRIEQQLAQEPWISALGLTANELSKEKS